MWGNVNNKKQLPNCQSFKSKQNTNSFTSSSSAIPAKPNATLQHRFNFAAENAGKEAHQRIYYSKIAIGHHVAVLPSKNGPDLCVRNTLKTKTPFKKPSEASTLMTKQILTKTKVPRTNRPKRPQSRSSQKTKSNTNSSKHYGDMAVTGLNESEKPVTQARVLNRPYHVILKKEGHFALPLLTPEAPQASGELSKLCCNHLRTCKKLLWISFAYRKHHSNKTKLSPSKDLLPD